MTKRSFASLSAQEALHVAIFVEERNAHLYDQFAELFAEFKDPDSLEVATTFQEMAAEERCHGTMLLDRYLERFGIQPCSVTEDEIRDFIEVPKLDSGDLFAITRSNISAMPRQQALQVALAAEQSALRFYSRLAEVTEDTEMCVLYSELCDFEEGHTLSLQRRLDAMRTPESDVA